MIYDRLLGIYVLQGGNPLSAPVKLWDEYLCAEQEVFHRRYWEAVQAGYSITSMVQIPGHIEPDGELYARLDGARWYRVEQLQRSYDADSLPVTILSLSRTDRRFEILKKE